MGRAPTTPREKPDYEATAAQTNTPGVTDDGSGTAAVLELARVMSQYYFDKTSVLIAFAAEGWASKAAKPM